MKFKIMPPVILFILLLMSLIFHFVLPIQRIIHSPFIYLGILIIGIGVILNVWADSLFKKKNIPIKPHDNPTSLETLGPFRISRHPMYLGMVIILFGVFVLLGSIVTIIFPIIFIVVMNIIFIPFEEKNLDHIFGNEYLAYKQKVRCWI